MILRPYDRERDRDAAHRVWREVGWSDGSPAAEEATDLVLDSGQTLAGEVEGSVESLVTTSPGTIRYLAEDLPLTVVTGVTTSPVARRLGLAARLLAASLARDAEQGALLSILGMFDQGFYDRLGFATGSYENWVAFDPALLIVDMPHRIPHRFSVDDWAAVHAARLQRLRFHGSVNVTAPNSTRAEMLFTRQPMGLGYHDGPNGTLSHLVWLHAVDVEHGPYEVRWLAYQNRAQFLELLALLKSLGDQVPKVILLEPAGVQMQVLVKRPMKQHEITKRSPFAAGNNTAAWWQARILDLPGCLARTHLPGETVRFNLRLSDPVERYLDARATWRGVAGDYVVTLGSASGAELGSDPALPTLAATVNAFTRLWLGVGPATGLALTDDLEAPSTLLAQLDRALCLPRPLVDWEV